MSLKNIVWQRELVGCGEYLETVLRNNLEIIMTAP
jgi:hypothetical protein